MRSECDPAADAPTFSVLLSAYACEPQKGSEPAVGWQILRENLRAGHRVTVVTRGNNVASITNALSRDERSVCKIVAYDVPGLRTLKRYLPGGTQAYYFAWQLTAHRVLRRIASCDDFDVIHHATFAVDWMPCAAARAKLRLPLVWGPVGGSERTPREVRRFLGAKGRISDRMRQLIGGAGRRLYGRRVVREAALVVAQNSDERELLAELGATAWVEPNVFISEDDLQGIVRNDRPGRRVLGVGRLLPWKGWALAIEAMKHLPNEFELDVFGAGPDLRRLQRYASRHDVRDRVHFHGQRSREEVLRTMADAHCLVHPSFHEAAGAVVAEATTIGCPVVTLDVGGSSEIARQSGGSVVKHIDRDLAGSLARSIASVNSGRPTDRWRSERLRPLLRDWYETARSR